MNRSLLAYRCRQLAADLEQLGKDILAADGVSTPARCAICSREDGVLLVLPTVFVHRECEIRELNSDPVAGVFSLPENVRQLHRRDHT